jgi:excisionase family DNA binding protein
MGSRSGPTEAFVDSPRRATLTVSEAAIVLGVSRSTAYELARTGELPSLRLGRRVVVPTTALRSLLDRASLRSEVSDDAAAGARPDEDRED